MVSLASSNEDHMDGPRRCFVFSPGLAERVEIDEGALIELRGSAAVPLRGWVRISDSATDDTLALGPDALRLIGASPGDQIEARAVLSVPA